MNRPSLLIVAIASVAGTAMGCSVDMTPAPDLKYAKFDMLCDFERGTNLNSALGFNSSFIASADKSPGGPTFMATSEELPVPRTNPDGTVSKFALHAHADGKNTMWGTAWQATFMSNASSVDLSDYTGISFWTKSEILPVPTVKFALVDAGSYAPPSGQLLCDPNDNRPVGNGCYDDYSQKVYPDGEWRRNDIAFGSMTNGGWGLLHPFDLTQIFAIKFAMLPSTVYDLWIDDIYLYRRQ